VAAGGAPAWSTTASGPRLQQLMSEHVGVLRDSKGLETAAPRAGELAEPSGAVPSGTENWEATNLLTVATVLASVARRRRRRGLPLAATTPRS